MPEWVNHHDVDNGFMQNPFVLAVCVLAGAAALYYVAKVRVRLCVWCVLTQSRFEGEGPGDGEARER
jgi:hypothetical protein